MEKYYVYIMTNASRTLYVGVTNDLARRAGQHKEGFIPGFTSKYHVTLLAYFEEYTSIREAIARERQIKGWRRDRKINLIESINPRWRDLAG